MRAKTSGPSSWAWAWSWRPVPPSAPGAGAFLAGGSLKWLAVAPKKWDGLGEIGQQLAANAPRYGALFVLWAAAFGVGARALGLNTGRFLASFALLFLASVAVVALGAWIQADH